jgi:hypothetical protein
MDTRLEHCAAVYVPHNEPGQSATVQRVKVQLCNAFGGATVQRVTGTWINERGQLIDDIIDRVYSFNSATRDAAETLLRAIALDVKQSLQQDTVLIEIDGQAILI